MPFKVQINDYKIVVNGTDLSKDSLDDVLEITVDSAVFLPTACTLVLNNLKPGKTAFTYSESTTFDPGKTLKITFSAQDPDKSSIEKGVVFDGEIVAVEAEYNAVSGSLFRVRAYDKAFHMAQGKKTATFLKVKDSDLFSKLATLSGLQAQTVTTSSVYDYVIQANQSDWDFFVSRAHRNGLLVQCEGSKLTLKKPSISKEDLTLKFPENLYSFEPRLSLPGQITKSTSIGWDYKQKQAITSQESASSNTHQAIGFGKTGSAAFKSAIGAAEEVMVENPVFSTDDAKALAGSRWVEAEGQFVRAEGICAGNPAMRAGKVVKIEGVGTRFSGKYFLSQVRHEINSSGYQVWFSINGSTPETLLGLLERGEEQANKRIDGVVTALVTNIADPDKAGKIKVKFPWMPKSNGAEIESGWARMIAPGTGKDRGLAFFPEVDDEVLVAFEQGDVNYPVIVGALWNGKDTPPKEADLSSGKNNTRVIKSRSGHLVILDDTSGKEKITVKDKSGKNSIVIDTTSNTITLSAEKDLVFTAKGKIKFSGDQGITLDSKQDVGVTSQTKVALAAASSNTLELAMAGATLKGMKVELTGTTTAALKGSAMVEIQGGIVKIN